MCSTMSHLVVERYVQGNNRKLGEKIQGRWNLATLQSILNDSFTKLLIAAIFIPLPNVLSIRHKLRYLSRL
jgi:hypothetical protein